MAFFQDPPALGNQLHDDRVLRSYLARVLPADILHEITPGLAHLGALAGGELYAFQLRDRSSEPRLLSWDAYGNRVDEIEVSPLWQRAARLAAEEGLIATAYERAHGALSRVHHFARVYLFDPSTDVYTCPLAMTDGAARTLLHHGDDPLGRQIAARAVPRLCSRDPETAWTSGQWMTERTGGSDVGLSETVARPDGDGFRLYGTKWFTSAITSQMALTLARPEGNPAGGRGLALFYVEIRDEAGRLNGITVNRLKDKLGTRKVPTAELTLQGTRAVPVAGLSGGVRAITPMLTITRTWNAVCAAAGMRRAVALCRDYARRRFAFGALLADKPLHLHTLAGMQAEAEGAFHLAFRAVELLGRQEAGVLDSDREIDEDALLRLVTPLAKLTTGKQAVAVTSEALECFGGAGYVEDTGLPRLLRDAQVLPIWEGTTNVLALDVLRALSSLPACEREVVRLTAALRDPALLRAGQAARQAVARARRFAETAAPLRLEAGARRLALTLGRAWELALLCHHGQWALDTDPADHSTAAAALRLWGHGVDQLPADPDGPAGAPPWQDPTDEETARLALG